MAFCTGVPAKSWKQKPRAICPGLWLHPLSYVSSELFREPEIAGMGHDIELLHNDGRAAEGGVPGAKVGVAVFAAQEPPAGEHCFDAAAYRPAGAGGVIGLRVWKAAERENSRTAGIGRAVHGRFDVLPLHAAGCVNQPSGCYEISEAGAKTCIPGVLDLAEIAGVGRQCDALQSIDVLAAVAPGEIAFDADQPVWIELPVVAEIAADAESRAVITLRRGCREGRRQRSERQGRTLDVGPASA